MDLWGDAVLEGIYEEDACAKCEGYNVQIGVYRESKVIRHLSAYRCKNESWLT